MSRKSRTPVRPPRGAEVHMDLEAMHAVHDGAANSISWATKTERLIMAADLAKTALRLRDAGKPLGVFSWSRGVDELQLALERNLMRFVQAGRRQVAGELARQEAARAGNAKTMHERPGSGAIALAGNRRARSASRPAVTTAGAVAATSVGIAAGIHGAMREAAAAAVTGKAGESLTVSELESTILAASDEALLRLSASVSSLVSLGRSEEAAANSGRIEDAVYSALLDGNCCDECAAMDGQTTTNLEEADTWAPNGSCAGMDRCRCVVVWELAQ